MAKALDVEVADFFRETVSVEVNLLWNVLEAARGNRQPDPGELREVEETLTRR